MRRVAVTAAAVLGATLGSQAPAMAELPPGNHEVIVYAAGPLAPPAGVVAVRPDGSDATSLPYPMRGTPSLSGGEVVVTSPWEGPGGKPGLFIPPADKLIRSLSNGTNSRTGSGGAPSISPGGTELVYNSASTLTPTLFPESPPFRGDLFRAPLELAPATNLTNTGPADEGEPDWFGDGSRIVFESNLDGPDYDVFAAGADGSGRVNLTPASDDDDLAPAVSPDGTRIAFARRTGDGTSDLWTMGPDGSAPTRITNTPSRNETDPVFSPDGSQIAFGGSEDGASRSDVFVIGADGTGEASLTAGTAAGGRKPDWGGLTVLPEPPACNQARSDVVGTEAGDRLDRTKYPLLTVASGLGGDDRIRGGSDGETLCGNAGRDVLNGSLDDDTLIGGAGEDVLRGGRGRDVCLRVGKRDRTSGCKVLPNDT